MRSGLPRRIQHLWILFVFSLAFTACSLARSAVTPTPTSESTAIPFPTDTATPAPSATPLPPLVILLVPAGADPGVTDALQTTLSDLSAEAGLRFQVRPGLSSADLKEPVKLVVALPPDPGLAGLVSAAPQTQFLAIGIPGVEPADNLSLVGAQGERPDQMGFLAGYIAASITTDWRVGVLSEQNTAAGKAARLGFTNGVFYFCGLCRPVYPPFPVPGYPLFAELPSGSASSDWQAAITYFQAWQVQTVYVAPEVSSEGLLSELAKSGFDLIGSGAPPAEVGDQWVASIGLDNPVQEVQKLWPELINGQGGANLELPIVISEANPDLLSPGKQRLAESLLSDLMAGYVDTGVDPSTGESR